MSSHRQTLFQTAPAPISLPAITCEVVRDFSRLEELRPQWQRLWEASPQRHVFQTFEWARAWWTAFGAENDLLTPSVSLNDKVIGILPLVRRGNVLYFLGSPQSDYNGLICDQALTGVVLRAALDALLALKPQWKEARLQGVRTDSSLASGLEHLPSRLRQYIATEPHSECPTVLLSKGGNPFVALARKESMRRHRKRLEQMGRLSFSQTSLPGQVRHHLPNLFKQHLARHGPTSEFSNPASKVFYFALVDELAASGSLRFGILKLDSRPIAYHLGFEIDGKFTWYKTGFDLEFARCGPGDVLISELFSYCSSNGVEEFDFTIGREKFKYRFANSVAHTLVVRVQPRLLDRMLFRTIQSGKKLVRQYPRVEALIRRIRSFDSGPDVPAPQLRPDSCIPPSKEKL